MKNVCFIYIMFKQKLTQSALIYVPGLQKKAIFKIHEKPERCALCSHFMTPAY